MINPFIMPSDDAPSVVYAHAMNLAFEVESIDAEGDSITADEIRDSVKDTVAKMSDSELLSLLSVPHDVHGYNPEDY